MIAALLKKYSLNARLHVTCLSSYCAGISEVFLMSIFEFHLVEYICLQLSFRGPQRLQMTPLGSTSEHGCLRLEYFELFDLHMLLIWKLFFLAKGSHKIYFCPWLIMEQCHATSYQLYFFAIDFDTNYIFAIAFQRN